LLRRDRRDLAHRFPFLFGDTIGFCSSPAQRRIDRVQERILIEGFEKAVHGTVSENTPFTQELFDGRLPPPSPLLKHSFWYPDNTPPILAVPLNTAEEILGRAIKGRRDQVLISTKAHLRTGPGPNDAGILAARISPAGIS